MFFNQTFSNLTLCLDFNFNMNYFGFEPRMFLFTDAPKWKSPEGARQPQKIGGKIRPLNLNEFDPLPQI